MPLLVRDVLKDALPYPAVQHMDLPLLRCFGMG